MILLIPGSGGDDKETPGRAESAASEAGLADGHLPGPLQTDSNGTHASMSHFVTCFLFLLPK